MAERRQNKEIKSLVCWLMVHENDEDIGVQQKYNAILDLAVRGLWLILTQLTYFDALSLTREQKELWP